MKEKLNQVGASLFDFRARATDSQGAAHATFREFAQASVAPGRPAVITTIDRLAEGISVPDVDMLVMLRATLSPRVAVQALGRGLRRAEGKEECVVLDAVQFRRRLDLWDAFDETDQVRDDDVEAERDNETSAGSPFDLSMLELKVSEVTQLDADEQEQLAAVLGIPVSALMGRIKKADRRSSIRSLYGDSSRVGQLGHARDYLDHLGQKTVSDARRDEDTIAKLAKITGKASQDVETILGEAHGRTRLDRAFPWPAGMTEELFEWYRHMTGLDQA